MAATGNEVAAGRKEGREKTGPNLLTKIYLLLYNGLMTVGYTRLCKFEIT